MGNQQTRYLNHNQVFVKLLVQPDDYIKVWITENDIKLCHDTMIEYREYAVKPEYLEKQPELTPWTSLLNDQNVLKWD